EGLRQKTIVVKGSEQLINDVNVLTKQGFNVIKDDEVNADDVIDALVSDDTLSTKEIEEWTAKGLKIVWTTEEISPEDASLVIISGKNLLEEARRVRANK